MVIARRHDIPFCREDILDSSAQQLLTLVAFQSGYFCPVEKTLILLCDYFKNVKTVLFSLPL